MNESPTPSRHAPAWLFGITNIPFGVSGTYAGVSMPFFLARAGLPVDKIAALGALALLPAAYQLFWAPVIDLGIRRRAWLVLVSVLGALCLGASMLLKLPQQLVLYEVLMVAGQLLVGLVGSCNGALISTTLPDRLRGQAAGWVNAANLGAAVLGGGLVMTLATRVSLSAAAIGLGLMIVLPSLAAFAVPEPPPAREPLGAHLRCMARDVWKAVSARTGWTGLVLCASPVGTAALLNLFSALGKDYGANEHVVEWVNGYAGGFVTAAGALICGLFLDRVNRRAAYLACGALSAFCALAMAMGPLNQTTFIAGALAYLFAAGFCYAAFSAFVYEIVGTAGNTASTLYTVFPAAGNQAIAYVMFLDGLAHLRWGPRGMLYADAALNLLGVAALLYLTWMLLPRTPALEVVEEAAA